jgi:CheY-like chemotaxis protein
MAWQTVPVTRITLAQRRRRRLLVIDDDALGRALLADAFAARGFDVVTAEDGTAGMARLTDELLSLDLVVTDVFMPGLDGAALIEMVRHAGGEHDLAIVAFSARLTPDLRARLETAGADAVVDKALGAERIAATAAEAFADREEQLGRS